MNRNFIFSILALALSCSSFASSKLDLFEVTDGPDIILGRIYSKFPVGQGMSAQSICNVYASKTLKTRIDSAGNRDTLIDRATTYNSDITAGVMMRQLLASISSQVSSSTGPSDAPFLEVKAFINVGAEVLLYRRNNGKVEQNLDATSMKIEKFIRTNCDS